MALETPSVADVLDRSHVVSIPLKYPFRGVTDREVMIIEGETGPAEWAPFPEYDDGEAAWWLASALEQGFSNDLPPKPNTVPSIRINGIIPALPAADIAPLVKKFAGVTSFKVKVGEPGQVLVDDIARLSTLRQLAGSEVTIRLDANAAWQVTDAEKNIFMLDAFHIDYIEQPVETVSQLSRLRERLRGKGVRIAADESLRKTHRLDDILDQEAADLVVLKVNPLGGIVRCLEIARRTKERGVDVVVSSGLETSVGLSHAAHLQALLIDRYTDVEDAGLGTITLLDGDVVTQSLTHTDGSLPVTSPVLDPRKLKKFRVDNDRREWWARRLRRVYDRLGGLD
jgi:O-succinylbenzoate synthase